MRTCTIVSRKMNEKRYKLLVLVDSMINIIVVAKLIIEATTKAIIACFDFRRFMIPFENKLILLDA